MRALLMGACALLFATAAVAKPVHVNGYYKSDGTYVAPYVRTSPDNSLLNNYSTKGNVNPYTGKPGTVDPYSSSSSSSLYSPKPSSSDTQYKAVCYYNCPN